MVSILAKFEFESRLDSLDECHGIAGPTGALLSDFVCEIKSIYISEVVFIWHFIVRNIIGMEIVFLPFLSEI